MEDIKEWILFWIIGINKCKECKGSGDGDPYGDSIILGSPAHFACKSCDGTGTKDKTGSIKNTVTKRI